MKWLRGHWPQVIWGWRVERIHFSNVAAPCDGGTSEKSCFSQLFSNYNSCIVIPLIFGGKVACSGVLAASDLGGGFTQPFSPILRGKRSPTCSEKTSKSLSRPSITAPNRLPQTVPEENWIKVKKRKNKSSMQDKLCLDAIILLGAFSKLKHWEAESSLVGQFFLRICDCLLFGAKLTADGHRNAYVIHARSVLFSFSPRSIIGAIKMGEEPKNQSAFWP